MEKLSINQLKCVNSHRLINVLENYGNTNHK